MHSQVKTRVCRPGMSVEGFRTCHLIRLARPSLNHIKYLPLHFTRQQAWLLSVAHVVWHLASGWLLR